MSNPGLLQLHPEIIVVFMEAPDAPSLATLSADAGQISTEMLEVEETRPPSRVHQAHTVPGRYYVARGCQPNVADLFSVSCWAKIYSTLTDVYDYCIAPYIPGRHGQARKQGPFRRTIHPCSPPREIWRRQMCTAAAAAVLRLLLRLLLLLLLQLLRGCDENRAGDSRLGDSKMCEGSGAAGHFLQTKQKRTKNCKS